MDMCQQDIYGLPLFVGYLRRLPRTRLLVIPRGIVDSQRSESLNLHEKAEKLKSTEVYPMNHLPN